MAHKLSFLPEISSLCWPKENHQRRRETELNTGQKYWRDQESIQSGYAYKSRKDMDVLDSEKKNVGGDHPRTHS